MSYRAKINGETFFDTAVNSEKYKLTQAQVVIPESFTFVVPPQNSHYNTFKSLRDYVDVYRDDELIFTGRVYSTESNFNRTQKVVCEHISAILSDAYHRPCTYENTTNREVFRALVENYNSQVEATKQLTVGRITVTEAACYRAYEKLEKISTRINDLVDAYGGHINVRKEISDNGDTLYIDWLQDYDKGSNQVIRFGQNILDIKRAKDQGEIITVLIPYGATEDDKTLDITSVNDGKDYIVASDDAIAKHGRITGTATWSDVTIAANLKSKAEKYLEEACREKVTINVTAVDLADAGYNAESFRVGQRLYVNSEAHDLNNEPFDCKQQTLNLLNPAQNTLTLGNETRGMIETQRAEMQEIKDAVDGSKTDLQKAVIRATSLISGNLGGYVVLHDADADGYPDEVLIMDTPDIDTAVKVWRWNNSGLGYSSTGYNGDFGLAMTIDGEIVADYITTGTLNASRIKAGILKAQNGASYWDLDKGELYIESQKELENRLSTAESSITQQASEISSKVSQSSFDTLQNRVTTAESSITQQADEISLKLAKTDYTGERMMLLINADATGAKIQGKHLNISGKNVRTTAYTNDDLEKIKNIIMGTVTPTDSDYARLDFNSNGRIDAVDYVMLKKMLNDSDTDKRYWSQINISTTAVKDVIVLQDRIGKKTRLSATAIATPQLLTDRLTLSSSIFKIKEITKDLEISADASSQYWNEGSILLEADSGYEILGTAGFSLVGQSDSYKPYMMMVYRACTRQNGSSYYFDYGITNTGTNTQKVTLKYYLMEARTKEEVSI